jgi:CBS domain-containing protein
MLTVQDMMTTELSMLPREAPIQQAARMMRDEDIGDVLVIDDEGSVMGLVTDRDITVRAIADGMDPSATMVGDICSSALVTASPEQDIDEVMELMQDQAVRRIPVLDGDHHAIGLISLGDLAMELQPNSTLGQISAQQPNR